MPRYYPMNLDVEGKPCLIIGGGKVAERKTLTLLEYKAAVTIISPEITLQLTQLAENKQINYERRRFQPSDPGGFFLVLAATNDNQINALVAQEAKKRGLLVNVVDSPGDSSFILPATVQRGDLVISITTGGNSPALARKIREELEAVYGREYEIFVDLLGIFRQEILQQETDEQKRRLLFEHLAGSFELIEFIKKNGRQAAEEKMREIFL